MKTEELKDYTLTYDDSAEAKERIYQTLLAWFKEQENYNGESIQQSDSTFIDAPNLLEDLAENGFRFETDWKE